MIITKLMIAAEDQRFPTRHYQANIIKMDQTQFVDCVNKKTVSIDLLVSGCLNLTTIEYKKKALLK